MMRSRSQRRRRAFRYIVLLSALSAFIALPLSACELYDFDAFDTSLPRETRDAGPPLEASTITSQLGTRDFIIDAGGYLRLLPGEEAGLVIHVQWTRESDAGVPRPVTLTIGHGPELDAATDETFEAIRQVDSLTSNESSEATASTLIQVSEKALPRPRKIYIRATTTNGKADQWLEVPVLIRGDPCTLDQTFGKGGRDDTIVLSAVTLPSGIIIPPSVEGDPFSDEVVIGAVGRDKERQLTVGAFVPVRYSDIFWMSPSPLAPVTKPPVLISPAPDAVYVASSSAVHRLVRLEDRIFDLDDAGDGLDAGVSASIPAGNKLGGIAAAIDRGVGVLCVDEPTAEDRGRWRVDRWGKVPGSPSYVVGERIDTIVPTADNHPRRLVRSGDGFVGCGTLKTIDGPRLTLARWKPSPIPGNDALIGDPAFGQDGRFSFLSGTAEAITCEDDGTSTIVLGTVRGALSLLSIGKNGALDPAFGESGITRVLMQNGLSVIIGSENVLTRLEELGTHAISLFDAPQTDGKTIPTIAVVGEVPPGSSASSHAYLNEYTRDGKTLRAQCDLYSLYGLKRFVGVAFDQFGRAYIFDANGVARVWL